MSEMINRMRKAFLERYHVECPDGEINVRLLLNDGPWRAAIEAMREPTEKIEDAARGLWLWYGGGKQTGWTIGKHNAAAGYGLSLRPDEAELDHLPKHVCGRIAWRTMIDAALAPNDLPGEVR